MSQITLTNIVKKYGDGFPAVNDVSIDIKDGEFMIFVGPSGCGKSTLLRMVVGLEDITSGELLIDGTRVNDLSPKDRNLSMVFQNYALYPHLTVAENIAFPLILAKGQYSRQEIDERVSRAAKLLELGDHLASPLVAGGGALREVAGAAVGAVSGARSVSGNAAACGSRAWSRAARASAGMSGPVPSVNPAT